MTELSGSGLAGYATHLLSPKHRMFHTHWTRVSVNNFQENKDMAMGFLKTYLALCEI